MCNASGQGGSTSGTNRFTVFGKGDLSYTGRVFAGWNTEADGAGTAYAEGDPITITEPVTLYAQWAYPVTYNANGGNADTLPGNQQKLPGINLELHAGKPSRDPDTDPITTTLKYRDGSTSDGTKTTNRSEAWEFTGWNTNAAGTGASYRPGETYDTDAALDLYAQWEAQNPTYGSTALPTPERDGYDFLGWTPQESPSDDELAAALEGGSTYTSTASGTLYAQWKLKTYEVTYNANGEGVTNMPDSPVVKNHGQDLTLSGKVPERAATSKDVTLTLNYKGGAYASGDDSNEFGTNHDSATQRITTTYTFGGWNTQAGGGGKAYGAGGAYDANAAATLYAVWTPAADPAKTYTLPSATRTPGSGSGVTSYKFIGWSTDPTATASDLSKVMGAGTSTAYDKDTYVYTPYQFTPTEDTTLYAVWDPPTYAIEYDGNAGGDRVTGDLSLQTKELNVDIALHGAVARQQPPSAFTVAYDPNGGNVTTADENTKASNTTQYAFKGWAEAANIGSASDGIVTDDEWDAYTAGKKFTTSDLNYTENKDIKLYAQWTKTGEVSPVTLPTPTRDGYRFAGWFTEAEDGTQVEGDGGKYTPSADITLYAHWDPYTYTVSYDANAGGATVGNMPNPATATKTYGEDLTLDAATPTRDDVRGSVSITYDTHGGDAISGGEGSPAYTSAFAFLSWKSDAGNVYAPGSAFKENGASDNAAMTLKAQWAETTTYTAVRLPSTSREGYIFKGWFTAASGGDEVGDAGDEYTPASKDAVTLHAQWEPVKYDVTYDGNTDDTSIENMPADQRKDHDDNAFKLSSSVPTRADTVTDSFEVTFDRRGGAGSPDSATTGATVRHTFAGWNTQADGEGTPYAADASYTGNAALTLFAQWNDAATGAEVTLPAAPTHPDSRFSFVGWSLSKDTSPSADKNASVDDESKELLIPGTKVHPTEAVTYYAIYNPPVYIVSYDANGGTSAAPGDQYKKHGEDLALSSAEPTRDGADGEYAVDYNADGGSAARASDTGTTATSYRFRGWAEDKAVDAAAAEGLPTDDEWSAYPDAKKHAAGSAYQTNADLDLFAQWEESVTYGPAMVTLPAADRPGHSFLGWYDEGGALVGGAGATYAPSGDYETLTARWQPYAYPSGDETFSYTVVFENPEGTQIGTQQFTFGQSQALDAGTTPSAPESGKVFAGWKLKGGASTFTEHQLVANLTNVADGTVYLVAQWKDEPAGGSGGGGGTDPVDPDNPNGYNYYTVEYYEQGTDGLVYKKESTDRILADTGDEVAIPASALDAPLGFHVDDEKTVASDTVADGGATKLEVYWARNQFDVEFLPGAADATGTMGAQHFVWANGEKLTANSFARAGYTFSGWKVTERDGNVLTTQSGGLSVQSLQSAILSTQAIGDSVADQADGSRLTSTDEADGGHVTLTAQWKKNSSGNGDGDDPNGGGGGSDDPDGPDGPDKPNKDPKDELADLIEEAEDLIDPDRDPDSDIDPDKPGLTDDERKLLDEIDEAKKVHDDPDATEGQVRDAIDRLTDAIAVFKAARDGDGSGGGASKADRTRGASGGAPNTGDPMKVVTWGLVLMALLAAAALALVRFQSRRSARVVGAWPAPSREAEAKRPTPRQASRGRHIRR